MQNLLFVKSKASAESYLARTAPFSSCFDLKETFKQKGDKFTLEELVVGAGEDSIPYVVYNEPVFLVNDILDQHDRNFVEQLKHLMRITNTVVEYDSKEWHELSDLHKQRNWLGKKTINQRVVEFLGEDNCRLINLYYRQKSYGDSRVSEAYRHQPANKNSYELLVAFVIRMGDLNNLKTNTMVGMTEEGLLNVDMTAGTLSIGVVFNPRGYELTIYSLDDGGIDVEEPKLTLSECVDMIGTFV